MGKVIAVEEGLTNVRDALARNGYTVVRPGRGGKADAVVITGIDKDFAGMQDIAGNSVVIDASGKTADEIISDLKRRL
ncbi:MAG TPA: YkuS family protein [Bacillota bacterium]|nr:YkuS family protein [Bacillota bacterium]